ncbi:MAG: DUF493 domain-containing protein [Succinatimonas hippei]|nr:DUF493 domain-containing protein [Succinatimonas hippei]
MPLLRPNGDDISALEGLHHTLKFPCVIVFRVIVDASFKDALKLVIAAIDEIDENSVMPMTEPPKASSKGNYMSYKLPVKVASKQNMDRVYEDLAGLPFVKHVL